MLLSNTGRKTGVKGLERHIRAFTLPLGQQNFYFVDLRVFPGTPLPGADIVFKGAAAVSMNYNCARFCTYLSKLNC